MKRAVLLVFVAMLFGCNRSGPTLTPVLFPQATPPPALGDAPAHTNIPDPITVEGGTGTTQSARSRGQQ